MRSRNTILFLSDERIQLMKCISVFVPIATGLLWGIHTLQNYSVLFAACLFVFGWLCWTFAEYITHRFFMHPKHAANKHGKGRHHEHHIHPTHIKITGTQRFVFFSVLLLLLLLNMLLPVYFIIFTGLYSGFVWYCYMHVILHKTWAARVFPGLQANHVFHHCKYPDKCFGVSVSWWDMIFKSMAPKEAGITDRIRRFYFTGKAS